MASITADLDAGAEEFSYADGSRTRLVRAERIVEAENETCKIKIEYDEQGQVPSEDTDGRVVRFVRDAVGALIAIVTPDGERIAFERDTEHRVRRVVDWSGAPYEVSYSSQVHSPPSAIPTARSCRVVPPRSAFRSGLR